MNKKRILSVFIALLMTFSMLLCTQASAAQSEVKVTFNGKTINFKSSSEPKTLEQVEKKWGKKTRKKDNEDDESEQMTYVWEKEKTTLEVSTTVSGKSLGHVVVRIEDTNASVAGVTVGMEKNEVLKKLQGIYGKKSVLVTKKGQDWDFFGEDGYIAIGAPKSDEDDCIYVLRGHYFPIYFDLEDNKVSYIFWGGARLSKGLALWL